MKNVPIPELNATFSKLSLSEPISLIVSLNKPSVFTTSFGLEDQVLTHNIANTPVKIITVDTGRLYKETYDLWAQTENREQIKIYSVSPDAQSLEKFVETNKIKGETHARSLVKAVTWRVTGSLDTFLLSWLFTSNVKAAVAISLSEVVTKIFLYYGHERLWARLKFGLGIKSEPENKDGAGI